MTIPVEQHTRKNMTNHATSKTVKKMNGKNRGPLVPKTERRYHSRNLSLGSHRQRIGIGRMIFLSIVIWITLAGISGAEVNISRTTIRNSTTWYESSSPYILTGDVSVYGDADKAAILTIEEGVVVKFNPGARLLFGNGSYRGVLNAKGKDTKPIIFTSNAADPQPGDWEGIYFTTPTLDESIMDYCIVEFGGQSSTYSRKGNIICDKGRITITNSIIRESGGPGVSVYNSSQLAVSSSDIHNNLSHGIYFDFNTCYGYISNNNLFNNDGYAVYCNYANDHISITGNQIYDNANTISVGANTLSKISDNEFNSNTDDAIVLLGGNILASVTLEGNRTYVIDGSINVYGTIESSPAVLTIGAGAELRFSSGSGLKMTSLSYPGVLLADGDLGAEITFTSNSESPAKGDWGGIYFDTSTLDKSILDHCVIEYGGYVTSSKKGNIICNSGSVEITNSKLRESSGAGISVYNSSGVSITNSEIINSAGSGIHFETSNTTGEIKDNQITGNGGWAIYFQSNRGGTVVSGNTIFGNAQALQIRGSSLPLFTNNTVFNNTDPTINILAGDITSNVTLENLGPYKVIGNNYLYIYGNSQKATLTVKPGVTMRFDDYGLIIGKSGNLGALYAEGTEQDPIRFSSVSEVPNSWKGIIIKDDTENAKSTLKNCIIEYAGKISDSYRQGNIICSNASPIIMNCTIKSGGQNGISVYDTSCPVIQQNEIIDNEENGIWLYRSGAMAIIEDNTISGNGAYGIFCQENREGTLISGNTISYNAYPLQLRALSLPLFTGNSVFNNFSPMINIIAGDIRSNALLPNLGPYKIVGNDFIRIYGSATETATLTLEEGVSIYFDGCYGISVGRNISNTSYKGAIKAVGTEEEPIVFSSLSAQPGAWRSIYFSNDTDTNSTQLDYCLVEYGGAMYNNLYGSITINNVPVSVTRSIIRNSINSGIHLNATGSNGSDISCNLFTGNANGIALSSNAQPGIANNTFEGNDSYDVKNNGSVTVIAQSNYWSDGNPKVYGNVDTSSPLGKANDCIPTLVTNQPPNPPFNPTPADNSFEVAVDVDVAWEATDNNLNDPLTFDIYRGTTPNELQLIQSGNDLYGYTFIGLNYGTTYYWQVYAFDGPDSQGIPGPVWQFTTENQAGAVPVLQVSDISWSPETSIGSGQDLLLTAIILNTGGGVKTTPYCVEFFIDGVSVGMVMEDQPLAIGDTIPVTLNWTAEAGQHIVKASLGSYDDRTPQCIPEDDYTETLPLISDLSPPLLVATSPGEDDYLNGVTQIEIMLQDLDSGIDIDATKSSIIVLTGGRTRVDGTILDNGDPFNLTLTFIPDSSLSDGYYGVSLTAYDAAGTPNQKIYSFGFTLDNTPPDPPSIITALPDPAIEPTLDIEGFKGEDDAVYLDGVMIVGATPSDTQWTHTLYLSSGDNTFTFTSVDPAGNESDPLSIHIFYDDIPPAPVEVLKLNGTGSGTAIGVSWPDYMEGADVATYYVYVELTDFSTADALVFKKEVPAGNTSCIIDNGILRNQAYYVGVVVEDTAGNKTADVNTFVVTTDDIIAPSDVSNLQIACIDGEPIVSWTPPGDDDFGGVEIHIDGTYTETLPLGQNDIRFPGLDPATSYEFTVKAIDGESPPNTSGGVSISGMTPLPNPQNITIEAQFASIKISWESIPYTGNFKYAVYKSTASTGMTEDDYYGDILQTDPLAITIDNLDIGVPYYFAVVTVNETGCTDLANATMYSGTPADDTEPPAIGDITFNQVLQQGPVTLYTDGVLQVDVSDNNEGFHVEFSVDGSDPDVFDTPPFLIDIDESSFADDVAHTLGVSVVDVGGNVTEKTFTFYVKHLPDVGCLQQCL